MATKNEISEAGKLMATLRKHPGRKPVYLRCPKCGKVTTGDGRKYSCSNPRHLEGVQ